MRGQAGTLWCKIWTQNVSRWNHQCNASSLETPAKWHAQLQGLQNVAIPQWDEDHHFGNYLMFSPWVKLYRKYCVSKAGNVKWFVYDFLILSELLPPSPSPPSSPPAASDPKCEFRISVGTAGPQLRAPDLSGHCRASTASSGSQWALPDLNREAQKTPRPLLPCPSPQRSVRSTRIVCWPEPLTDPLIRMSAMFLRGALKEMMLLWINHRFIHRTSARAGCHNDVLSHELMLALKEMTSQRIAAALLCLGPSSDSSATLSRSPPLIVCTALRFGFVGGLFSFGSVHVSFLMHAFRKFEHCRDNLCKPVKYFYDGRIWFKQPK